MLCVASSGIASLILTGGRTSHSMFQIPLELDEKSICMVKKGSDKANLMKEVSLIIWDEVPMQNRFACEAVDRSLRDILNKDVPFGGITVAWGGDFQQTLPVIPKGSKEDIVGACISRSHLWHKVNTLFLTENMCVDPTDQQSAAFAQWLLDIEHGKDMPLDHMFKVPNHMLCGPTVENLVSTIYPNIHHPEVLTDEFLLERAILCPRNLDVDEINDMIFEKFPGIGQTYYSVNSVKGGDNENLYPAEYLNSINFGGLSPSKLHLKPGVPLMLLRNLDPGQGLCNGTRLCLIHTNDSQSTPSENHNQTFSRRGGIHPSDNNYSNYKTGAI